MLAFGRWLFRYRNRAFPCVLLGLFVGFRPHLFRDSLSSDLWLDTAGMLLAIAGQWLRVMVVGYAYIKRGGLNKQVHADTLVTAGLFAHSRNPLYLGNLMILAGLFIIHNNPMVYLLGGVFFGAGYLAIIKTEENFLTAKFGDEYRSYCTRVNRWLPRWSGLGATMANLDFAWRRVLDKETASCIVWWLTGLGLLAWEARLSEAGLNPMRVNFLSTVAVVTVTIFFLMRFGKDKNSPSGERDECT